MFKLSRLTKPAVTALTVVVTTVGLSAPTASAGLRPGAAPATPATITWTVTPGGSVTGMSGKATLKDTTTGTALTCKSMSLGGILESGSGLKGKGLGHFTSAASAGCDLATISVSVSSSSPDWVLNAVSYKPGVTTGTLTGLHFAISATGCSFVIDGTSGTANDGRVKIKFTNAHSHLTTLVNGADLHSYEVTGCLGLVNNGDPWTFDPCYVITPAQTITGDPPAAAPAMTGPPC
jgi:hypothetical protein